MLEGLGGKAPQLVGCRCSWPQKSQIAALIWRSGGCRQVSWLRVVGIFENGHQSREVNVKK
jgi:hypothetical protein